VWYVLGVENIVRVECVECGDGVTSVCVEELDQSIVRTCGV
jgi:hypothetical protein